MSQTQLTWPLVAFTAEAWSTRHSTSTGIRMVARQYIFAGHRGSPVAAIDGKTLDSCRASIAGGVSHCDLTIRHTGRVLEEAPLTRSIAIYAENFILVV